MPLKYLLSSLLIFLIVASPSSSIADATVKIPLNKSADWTTNPELPADSFISFIVNRGRSDTEKFLQLVDTHWRPNLFPLLLESMVYIRSDQTRSKIKLLLRKKTGNYRARNPNQWFKWWWQNRQDYPSDYANFKAKLYALIDPSFYLYFKDRQDSAKILLDEIRWGGVPRDGIPPLHSPKMLEVEQASYLKDHHIVFGTYVEGVARAYPKRILAWHEMFTDNYGDLPVAGVYCTLCGTVILYKTKHKEIVHRLGTSGFLYRSNKLMYDKDTFSLWNTFTGKPVLGPLVDQGIELESLSVVTTSWGEWKKRHPETLVLSQETGHQRDYREGVAYREYFADHKLMFEVPFDDERLKNKQEILAIRLPGAPEQQLAIDTDFLKDNPIFYEKIGTQEFVVLTDNSGANRVYQSNGILFKSFDQANTLTDNKGIKWQLHEDRLLSVSGDTLERLPYHRAFWFGWHAAFPETKLIK